MGDGSDAGVLRMTFAGADAHARGRGVQPLPGKRHYYFGAAPAGWLTDIPTYARVYYEAVYPGIDLVYYGREGELEYDFNVAPGADPRQIRIRYQGASDIKIDDQGNLVLETPVGTVTQAPPHAYQPGHSGRSTVAARYVKDSRDQVSFRLAAYDPGRPLVIDPVLSFATYLGGGEDEGGPELGDFRRIAVTTDIEGNLYVTGATRSPDFPTSAVPSDNDDLVANLHNPGDSIPPPSDVFISKYNASGELLFSAYLGTPDDGESGNAIVVDEQGRIYVTGSAGGSGFSSFPTTPGAYDEDDQTGGLSQDVFVTVLENDGSALIYSTPIGGNLGDQGYGIDIDAQGQIYVTGVTNSDSTEGTSPAFPIKNPAFPPPGDNNEDGFVVKLNPAGQGADDLVYSTYLGGNGVDAGLAIAVDGVGNAYVTGNTSSSDFPTTPGALKPQRGMQSCSAFSCDAFVVKLDPDGRQVYGTYLGGSGSETGRGIAIDAAGSAYVTGRTRSAKFPAANNEPSGPSDAYVARLNAMGSELVFATYLGGGGDEEGADVAVDDFGRAHVTGWTSSGDFPVTDMQQGHGGGSRDAFVTRLNNTGFGQAFSSYLGGDDVDRGNSIALDKSNIYVAGVTRSTDLVGPEVNAAQSFPGGGRDAFVARISFSADLALVVNDNEPRNVGEVLTYSLNVTNNGPDAASRVVIRDPMPSGVTFRSANHPGCGFDPDSAVVTCGIGSLEAGVQRTVEIDVTVDTTDPVTNTASVMSDIADPDESDNNDSETTRAGSSGNAGSDDGSDDNSDGSIDINDPAGDGNGSSGGVWGPLGLLLLVIVTLLGRLARILHEERGCSRRPRAAGSTFVRYAGNLPCKR